MARIEEIAKNKPHAILLREKDMSQEDYKILAGKVIDICRKYDVTCILHSYVDAAKELGHSAIHIPLSQLRKYSSRERQAFSLLGTSCHTWKEAREAENLGCHYVVAGHVFDTDCKPGLPPKGTEWLGQICQKVKIPIYAIGGIHGKNIHQIQKVGVQGACVMSALMQCDEVKTHMKQLRPLEEKLRLYAVTDQTWTGKYTLYEQVEQVLKGGATCVQLREKQLDTETFLKEACKMRDLCHQYGVPLIINDNLQVALRSGADGIHVGQEDEDVKTIRQIAGKDFMIGVTAKTVEQAQKAERDGADYLGVGAVFPSSTKEEARRITIEQLKKICHSVSIPVVAIGGIDGSNMSQIAGCGMKGVALVSALFSAPDIEKETEKIERKLRLII